MFKMFNFFSKIDTSFPNNRIQKSNEKCGVDEYRGKENPKERRTKKWKRKGKKQIEERQEDDEGERSLIRIRLSRGTAFNSDEKKRGKFSFFYSETSSLSPVISPLDQRFSSFSNAPAEYRLHSTFWTEGRLKNCPAYGRTITAPRERGLSLRPTK